MEETVSRLQKAREEEKRLRKSFHSSHGVHFVTTLFPELQDRVPDITVSVWVCIYAIPDSLFLSVSFIPRSP